MQSQLVKYFLLVLEAILLAGISLPAQSEPDLDTLTVEDGLSQGFINRIIQDREGFLWIGTRNGLNRYDGRQFRVFMPDPLDPYSISASTIAAICELGDYLLVGTMGGGLNIFHKKTQRFFRPWIKEDNTPLFPASNCAEILIDQKRRIWCRYYTPTGQHFIVRLTLTNEIIFPDSSAQEFQLVSNIDKWDIRRPSLNCLKQTKQAVWGVDERKLFSIDKKTGLLKYHDQPCPAYCAFSTSDGTIWLGGDTGIGRLTENSWLWWETDFAANAVLFLADRGELLVAVKNSLYAFGKSKFNQSELKLADGQKLASVNISKVTTLYSDRSGVIWTGRNGYGLLKYSRHLNRFRTYFRGRGINTSVLIDANGHVGIKTGRQGLLSVSGSKHTLHAKASDIDTRAVMVVDNAENHWLLTAQYRPWDSLTLYKQSKGSEEWQQVLYIPKKRHSVFALAPGNDGNLWIAVSSKLWQYSPATKKLTGYSFSKILPINHQISTMAQTANGHWWIGTNRGLVQAIPEGSAFKFNLFQALPGEYHSIQNNQTSSLLVDPQNAYLLWVGTLGGGLSCLDSRSLKFQHFNTKTGFPNNVIYGILAEDANNLWMSSNKGIIRLDPTNGEIRNFTVKDGLPTDEFNIRAYAKHPDGTMYFGSVQGLVAFHPEEFVDNPFTPQVRITGLQVNNRNIELMDSTGLLNQAIEFTHDLKLPFSHNNITLDFAALEYTIPSKNQYKYYLKGMESEWVHSSIEGRASYLNLTPGQYTFLVKASNSDGVWNETPTALNITILPPWYRTNFAYVAYFVLVFVLGFGILRFFLHRQNLKHKLVLEQREAERLKELDSIKSRLFANLSHELRTPISLILTPIERILQQPQPIAPQVATSLKGAVRNSRKLLRLVEEIMELSKLDANALSLHESPVLLSPFCRQLLGVFQTESKSIGIRYKFSTAIAEETAYLLDQKHLEKIVNNLLSNATKFTPNGGAVELSLNQEAERLLIQVRDTGQGIAPADLPHIFDRYFQSKNKTIAHEGGAGIGLALAHELATLMQGTLEVESTWGHGSVFTLRLPAQKINVYSTANEVASTEEKKQQPAKKQVLPLTPEAGVLPGHATILIVEDNAEMRALLQSILEDHFTCINCNDGAEAWDLLNAENANPPKINLILSDIMMPGMDGYELLRRIKQHPHWKYCPVVMLTALADKVDKLAALRLGVDDYLAKPFSAQELLARVCNLIENDRRRKSFQQVHVGGTELLEMPLHWLQRVESIAKNALENKQPLTTPYLADQLALSERQLLRRIQAQTGLSVKAYIQEVKLQFARRMVESDSYLTIAEVAYASGFNTPAYFSKVFEKRFGKRPGAYFPNGTS